MIGIALAGTVATGVAAAPAKALPHGVVAACSWDEPGHNPFTGNVVQALDRYDDMPVAQRERLQARMAARQYDDIVVIKRDSIEGRDHYDPAIRDMYFGGGRICRSVSRKGWSAQAQERGLVYCDGTQCILVPTVCRNVSRVSRSRAAVDSAQAARDEEPQNIEAALPETVVPPDARFITSAFAAVAESEPVTTLSALPDSGDPGEGAPGPRPWPVLGLPEVHNVGAPYLPPLRRTSEPPPPPVVPPASVVPEPASALLSAIGLLACAALARRARRPAHNLACRKTISDSGRSPY